MFNLERIIDYYINYVSLYPFKSLVLAIPAYFISFLILRKTGLLKTWLGYLMGLIVFLALWGVLIRFIERLF